MLIYHPAFDAYHCVYRMILLTQTVRELEYLKLRILDFYLCFPAEIASIELPKDIQRIRPLAKQATNKFRGPVSSIRTFRDLEQIQRAATQLLTASGIFDSKKLEEGIVCRTNRVIPADFSRSSQSPSDTADVLTNFVLTQLSALPLQGNGGLKQRSGLMEYRYDPI